MINKLVTHVYLVQNLELPFCLSEIQNTIKVFSRNNHLSTERSSPKRGKRKPQITKKKKISTRMQQN